MVNSVGVHPQTNLKALEKFPRVITGLLVFVSTRGGILLFTFLMNRKELIPT